MFNIMYFCKIKSKKQINYIKQYGDVFLGKYITVFFFKKLLPINVMYFCISNRKKIIKKSVVRNLIKRRLKFLLRYYFRDVFYLSFFIVIVTHNIHGISFLNLKYDLIMIKDRILLR